MRLKPSASETRPMERGSALVLAVFVLTLLTGMGTALLFMSQNEMKMSRANLRTKQAFYLAEAGLEHGRMKLFAKNGKGPFGDDLIAAAGVDTRLNFDPETVTPVFDADGALTGFTGYGDDVPLNAVTSFGTANGVEGWFATFLTNDPVEMTNAPNTTDGDDRVMLHGVGVGPGGSMEVVQAIVEKLYRLPSIPPASITLLGPTPTFCSGSSSASDYVGDDCAGGYSVPIVGTVGPDALASVKSGFDKNPTYESGKYKGDKTAADLTNPLDPVVVDSGQPVLSSEWQDCKTLHDLVEEMRAAATWSCSTSCTVPAGSTVDDILFVDQPGNFTITSHDSNAGTLVVTGKLTFNGGADWDGMLMVIGKGEVARAGGGNGVVSGAVIVADIAGPDNIYGTTDDCTGGPEGDGFGIANYCVNGGGNGNITHCSTNIEGANPIKTYKIVEFLQR